ncbi:acyltransferase family protein [Piscinibacter terrae]|nr:acyltransferase [Albitalea terrae]
MKRIAALDGWRAISIALVLIGHLVNYRWGIGGPKVASFAAYNAQLGVKVFFVISGYLITTLSLKEEISTGGLHVGGFYLRRAFRILPAFFVYLLAVAAIALPGWIDQSSIGIQRAAEFSCDIPGRDCGWFANHTWSLAYEQQFYLLFPLIFMATLGTRLRWVLAVHLLVVAAPFVALFTGDVWHDALAFSAGFSSITMGVLLALLVPRLRHWVGRPDALAVALGAFAGSVLVVGLNLLHLSYAVRTAVDGVLLPPAVAWLIYTSVHSDGVFTRLLDARPVRYIGAISYSLYLWQQLFTGPAARYADVTWFVPLLALPAAALSYHFIEQPFIRWGRALSHRVTGRGAVARSPSAG